VDTERLKQLAKQHGFSEAAVQSMFIALQRGNGKMAQFNHPEFGGSGQWMPGMMMISDMFNNALKARVQGLCESIVAEMGEQLTTTTMNMDFMQSAVWWDSEFGSPSSSGGQNQIEYAYFQSKDRLFVKKYKKIHVYNTTGHVIKGVSQQQSNTTQTLEFNTSTGTVAETDLELIETRSI